MKASDVSPYALPRYDSAQRIQQVSEKIPKAQVSQRKNSQEIPKTYTIEVFTGGIRLSETRPDRRLFVDDCDAYRSAGKKSAIDHWSDKSRSNMTLTFAQLDYSPLLENPDVIPGMITLTLPGNWQVVAPDGATFKRHVATVRKRFERAFGILMMGIWKLEFQDRGAPHLHAFIAVPTWPASSGSGSKYANKKYLVFAGYHFAEWLLETWADVVDHPDPAERAKHGRAGTRVDLNTGLRSNDTAKVSEYFSKHSSPNSGLKEYQNRVPEEWQKPGAGPGRFWGVWNLEKIIVRVEVAPGHFHAALRFLRRWSRARGITHSVKKRRTRVDMEARVARVRGVDARTGEAGPGAEGHPQFGEERAQYRWQRRRMKRFPHGAGFIILNDAPQMVEALSRFLETVPLVDQFVDDHSIQRQRGGNGRSFMLAVPRRCEPQGVTVAEISAYGLPAFGGRAQYRSSSNCAPRTVFIRSQASYKAQGEDWLREWKAAGRDLNGGLRPSQKRGESFGSYIQRRFLATQREVA